jgi:hypothetical protein
LRDVPPEFITVAPKKKDGGTHAYVLVVFGPVRRQKETAEMTESHVKFISELIRTNKILLGILEDSARVPARRVPVAFKDSSGCESAC